MLYPSMWSLLAQILLSRGWLVVVVAVILLGGAPRNTWAANTLYVSPDGSGNSCSNSAPCSLLTANKQVQPGGSVVVKAGTYTDNPVPEQSGESSASIVYKSESNSDLPKISGQLDLRDRSYLIYQNFYFESQGESWLKSNSGTHHITLVDNLFHQTKSNKFYGMFFSGGTHHIIIKNNRFLNWLRGDAVYIDGDYFLVEGNDFSQAHAPHNLLYTGGDNLVVRGNYFRNPWDRVGGFQGERVLVENNIYFDSNWNGEYSTAGADFNNGVPGANQVLKFYTGSSIFRNNMMVKFNGGKDFNPTGSPLFLNTASNNVRLQNLRIYHNTFYLGDKSGIGIRNNLNSATDNNVFKNNVISGQNFYSLNISEDRIKIDDFIFIHNIFGDSKQNNAQTVFYKEPLTVDQAQQQYPQSFQSNLALEPNYPNPGVVNQAMSDRTRSMMIGFADFQLPPTAEYKAPALTEVIQNSSSSTLIRVADSYSFSDGLGVIEGDKILVAGGNYTREARVVGRPDATTLQVSPAISVATGDQVYLAEFGTAPVLGVMKPGVQLFTADGKQSQQPQETDIPQIIETPSLTESSSGGVVDVAGGEVTDMPVSSNTFENWINVCEPYYVEVSGIGMGNKLGSVNPQTMVVERSASGVLAQVAGRYHKKETNPQRATFSSGGVEYETSTLVVPKSDAQGWSFVQHLPVAGEITAEVDRVGTDAIKTPRGLITYSQYETDENWTSSGAITHGFVYGRGGKFLEHQEIVAIEPLPEPADIFASLVVIDNDHEEQSLIAKVTAGTVTATQTKSAATHGPELNIFNLVIADVPEGTSQVTVALESPEGEGESAVLVGYNINYPCRPPTRILPFGTREDEAQQVSSDQLQEVVEQTTERLNLPPACRDSLFGADCVVPGFEELAPAILSLVLAFAAFSSVASGNVLAGVIAALLAISMGAVGVSNTIVDQSEGERPSGSLSITTDNESKSEDEDTEMITRRSLDQERQRNEEEQSQGEKDNGTLPGNSSGENVEPIPVPTTGSTPGEGVVQPTLLPLPTLPPAQQGTGLRAFPGAEGFGSESVGGRGGKVYLVSHLGDSGAGSLRECIEANGPRVCIFRVGGYITLNSQLKIRNPYITIAGQTAPGDGITLRIDKNMTSGPLKIQTHDVILRYLSLRPGINPGQATGGESDYNIDAITIGERDSSTIQYNPYAVVIDHVSMAWTTDEIINTAFRHNGITIQWSIAAEAIDCDGTTSEGSTDKCGGKGPLIGGKEGKNVSFHHNLLTGNKGRNPMIKNAGGVVDIVNNVIFPSTDIATIADSQYATQNINYVGNYIKALPGINTTYMGIRLAVPYNANRLGSYRLFVKGNIGPTRPNDTDPEDWIVNDKSLGDPNFNARVYPGIMLNQPNPAPAVQSTSAEQALNEVLADAGASRKINSDGELVFARDSIDTRIVNDVRNGKSQTIQVEPYPGAFPQDWPVLKSGTPYVDIDGDGISDNWEYANFGSLDQGSADNSNSDFDQDGYTDLEEFLNGTTP